MTTQVINAINSLISALLLACKSMSSLKSSSTSFKLAKNESLCDAVSKVI